MRYTPAKGHTWMLHQGWTEADIELARVLWNQYRRIVRHLWEAGEVPQTLIPRTWPDLVRRACLYHWDVPLRGDQTWAPAMAHLDIMNEARRIRQAMEKVPA